MKNFELKQNPKKRDTSYIGHLEFNVTSKDKEKNLITLETNYNIRNNDKYGFIDITYDYEYYGNRYDDPLKQSSFSFIINENFKPYNFEKELFIENSKYNLFAFNQGYMLVNFRDKRIKLNIENELNKDLLSPFSNEEIKKINNCLNNMEMNYQTTNLIYQKVIHNIKDNKNYTKIYDIVFYPHISDHTGGPSSERSPQPIIVKKFKINNLLVKKEKKYEHYLNEDEERQDEEDNIDEPEEENEEGLELFKNGYYVSNHNTKGFREIFDGFFAVYEFDCVSNEKLDYFALNCFDPGLGFIAYQIIYGASYKYEIILNGNKIDFPNNKDFKYTIINDKILLEGTIDGNEDNFEEDKYRELCKKNNKRWWLSNDMEKNEMVSYWPNVRLFEFLPQKMILVKD